jgi:hypothetical protein
MGPAVTALIAETEIVEVTKGSLSMQIAGVTLLGFAILGYVHNKKNSVDKDDVFQAI